MRRGLAILLLLILVAGCTKPSAPTPTPTPTSDESPPKASPSFSTPTPTPTPTPSPAPSPKPTPSPTPSAPTPTPTPSTNFTPQKATFFLNVTHDYTQQGENKTFEIPNGTVNLTIDIVFTPGTTPTGWACAGAMSATVGRPDGSQYASGVASPAQGVGDPAQVTCGTTGPGILPSGGDVAPGNWTADFEGQGIGFARVYVHPMT